MNSELHGNAVYRGVDLLFLVSMLFLLAIPESLSIVKEFLYTSLYSFCISKRLWLHQINICANQYPFLKLDKDCAEHQAQPCHS